MIVVVLIFAICWLPYHVYFLAVHHYPDIANWDYIQPVFLSIYFLGINRIADSIYRILFPVETELMLSFPSLLSPDLLSYVQLYV